MLLGLGVLKFTDKPLRGADISFMRGLPRYMQHAVIAEQADALPGVPAALSEGEPRRSMPKAPDPAPSDHGQKPNDAAASRIERISHEADDTPDSEIASSSSETHAREAGEEGERANPKRGRRDEKLKKLRLQFDFNLSAGLNDIRSKTARP